MIGRKSASFQSCLNMPKPDNLHLTCGRADNDSSCFAHLVSPDSLRRVTCPALILCGRHDRLCPVERHEAMKQMMPHARLCIIEDAGHLPTIETPDQVTLALKKLLEIQDG